MNLILISTIEQPNIWLKKDSINFTIGLMNEHGIHLAESLVVSIVDKIIYNEFFLIIWQIIGTIYPGLMLTSAVLYHVMNFLHISIDVRNVCVFLAPLFSSLTTIVTFFLTRELKVVSFYSTFIFTFFSSNHFF